jgi:hypothetical protein
VKKVAVYITNWFFLGGLLAADKKSTDVFTSIVNINISIKILIVKYLRLKSYLFDSKVFYLKEGISAISAGNTKGGSIIIPLTSCLTDLD